MKDTITLAARIGIDWADDHHDFCLQEEGADVIETGQIRQDPASWPTGLRRFASASAAAR